ncbi:MAG: hypothetical protein ABF289_18725 [Clostridiales bacterium]
MENIFKKSFIYVIKNSWLILLTLVIVFSSYKIVFDSKKYTNTSVSKVFVYENKNKAYSYNYYQNILKNNLLSKDYSEFTKTDYFLNKLLLTLKKYGIKNLNKDELSNIIKVNNVEESRIITIETKYDTPGGSVLIANETAKTLKNEIKNIFLTNNINIIESSTLPNVKSEIIGLKDILFFFFLSITIGLILISLKHKLEILDTKDIKKAKSNSQV